MAQQVKQAPQGKTRPRAVRRCASLLLDSPPMSRAATRFFLTRWLLALPLPKWEWQRRRGSSIFKARAYAMAASGFGGGDSFRLSAAPGAGALKLHKGDITLWSVNGTTDAIVSVPAPPFSHAVIRVRRSRLGYDPDPIHAWRFG